MSYTEHYIAKDDKPFCCIMMYNSEGLIKDKKLIETQTYKDYIAKGIVDCGVETIEEFAEFYDECGFSDTFEEHKIEKMINGMCQEKLLIFNSKLAKGDKGYYIPDDITYYDK